MKRKEHSWMYTRLDEHRLIRDEFVKGVDEFVDFSVQHPHCNDHDKIRCPCIRCKNQRYLDVDTVKLHLYKKGFTPNYYEWLCHGEGAVGLSSSSTQSNPNPYRDMVFDALANDEDRSLDEVVTNVDEEPNGDAKKFIDLLKAVEDPLYEGSKMSVLEMASRITSLKCEYNLPHRCVDGFASLMNEAIPNDNQMTRTFYDTKKILKGLELPHQRIHTCPRGCTLFWKEKAHLDKCSVCGTDRYKKTSKSKFIPAKVLFYFTITPRLQRLFATKNISEEMAWHAKNPRMQGTMAHPSDSEAWKHFDRSFPDFASDARNVRLGLCTDGFSPYGKFGGQHSCWPVILTPYNLPPSMCMKKPFMFLHRQFLPSDHPFRKNKSAFCRNRVENDQTPHIMSGEELWQCVKDLPKATDGPEALIRLKKEKKGWSKQNILWELPYWKDLLIRHNLDVMHIEKNFFDQLINTVMDVKGQTSDTTSARKDMAKLCKRRQLELVDDARGNQTMPKAPFALDKAEKKVLCEWVRDLKFPDGFASNLSRCVDLRTCMLHGMKSHDCHVFMERLLPVGLKELFPIHVWKAITEISLFFRDLCAPTIKVSEMDRLEKNIAEILCKLEKIFPPSFFNSMEHLPVHLPYEAKVGGPVQYRWIYPFERFLNHLKRKVGNKARVEGSICNAYLTEEIANFCSNYFQPGIDTKSRDLGRNTNPYVQSTHDSSVPEMFREDCGRSASNGRLRWLNDMEYDRAHLYVLANSGILGDYERQFENHIVTSKPHIAGNDVWSKCEKEFPGWFKSYVLRSTTTDDVVHALAMGPSRQVRTWSQFYVNGYNFHTHDYGKNKSTMNYGVCVESEDGVGYYGILEDVLELFYYGDLDVYRTILFKCSWMDCNKGMSVHEQYKLVEVNHTKRYPKYDPFVLSYQVNQVYYAPYPSLKRDKAQWWVVFKTKARSEVDAPVDLDFLQEDTHATPTMFCAPNEIPDYESDADVNEEDVVGYET